MKADSFQTLPKIPYKSVDLILTDPPYDLTKKQMTFLHEEFTRISKTGYITFSSPENQWMNASQYAFWIKPISTKNTSRRYSRFVEMIFFYGPLKWNSKRHWSQYTNVFTDLVERHSTHPFEKPYSLLNRLILNHSDVGDIILDPFCGSKSTIICANRLGRIGQGWDIEDTSSLISVK